jgi:hypothetical protein
MESGMRRELARHQQAEFARMAERELLLGGVAARRRFRIAAGRRLPVRSFWRRTLGTTKPEVPEAPAQMQSPL